MEPVKNTASSTVAIVATAVWTQTKNLGVFILRVFYGLFVVIVESVKNWGV